MLKEMKNKCGLIGYFQKNQTTLIQPETHTRSLPELIIVTLSKK